jgi:hypothetical protein
MRATHRGRCSFSLVPPPAPPRFYLVFPLLLWLVCGERVCNKPSPLGLVPPAAGLGCLVLLSVAACAALTALQPDTAFYSLPSRLWELAIGAVSVVATEDAQTEWLRRFTTTRRVAILDALSLVLLALAFGVTQTHPGFPLPWPPPLVRARPKGCSRCPAPPSLPRVPRLQRALGSRSRLLRAGRRQRVPPPACAAPLGAVQLYAHGAMVLLRHAI